MNFEEDEFKDPDEIALAGAALDDGLDDDIFDDDADAVAPDLIAGDDPDETDAVADL